MADKNAFDVESFLPYLLTQAAEETSLSFQKEYKGRYGMLRTEWRVLFHLGNYGVMTAQEIGARSKVHKTKISRAVQKLAEKRFLVRKTDKDDRRRELLELTVSGKEAFKYLRKAAQRHDEKLIEEMTKKEEKVLRRALQKLAGLPHRPDK
ncbi:MAG: MarR family winged helix-turn-helix transcriptional regulator [Pseudomonadota bacterium]